MKKLLIPITWMLIAISVKSQAPGLLNYQGVARNSVGNVLVNKAITLRLSIREGSGGGTLVYQETRSVVTNPFGLFNIQIGSPGASSTTGTIAGTNWSSGSKFIQVEIDPNGGNAFINIGAAQLAAVPYALHASSAFPIGTAGGSLTGNYPNPVIANAAVIQTMIAPGVTLPPSGPAGGSLSGLYPNPLVANSAIIQSMIAPGVTLPPSGPAGGSLTGVYPDPTIANGAIIQAMLAPGVSLPPAGAAGGDLGGNYPNPGVNRIRGINVSAALPGSNFILSYDGTNWSPTSLALHPDNYWRSNGGAIYSSNAGGVGLGTNTPASSAKLDIQSTTSGLLMPRMTETQRNAIASPATGLMIYQTNNEPGFYFYDGTAWMPLNGSNSGNDDFWSESTPLNISNMNIGNVGIGETNPSARLHVKGGLIPMIIEGLDPHLNFFNTDYSSSFPIGHLRAYNNRMVLGTDDDNITGRIDLQTNGMRRMQISDAGRVLIGENYCNFNAYAGYKPLLNVQGAIGLRPVLTASDEEWAFIANPDRTLVFTLNAQLITWLNDDGDWNTISDRTLKSHFAPYKPVLNDLKKLDVLTYRYKTNPNAGQSFGLIAQNVQEFFPEIVDQDEGSGLVGISYSKTGVLAIKAIQEQQVIIETLEAKLELLEKRLALLEARLK